MVVEGRVAGRVEEKKRRKEERRGWNYATCERVAQNQQNLGSGTAWRVYGRERRERANKQRLWASP